MTSTIVGPPKTRTSRSNPDTEFDGYFAIKISTLKCGCGKVMEYVETDYRHIIIVWEDMDDDALLSTAAGMKKLNLNPKVVEYEAAFGRCVEYYTAVEKGLIEG